MAKHNGIKDPNKIFSGQQINLGETNNGYHQKYTAENRLQLFKKIHRKKFQLVNRWQLFCLHKITMVVKV